MHFDRIRPIFKIVTNGNFIARQFTLFASHSKTDSELTGKRRTENKSARFDADDLIDLLVFQYLMKMIERRLECFAIFQKRSNIPKENSRLREIRYIAYEFFQV